MQLRGNEVLNFKKRRGTKNVRENDTMEQMENTHRTYRGAGLCLHHNLWNVGSLYSSEFWAHLIMMVLEMRLWNGREETENKCLT